MRLLLALAALHAGLVAFCYAIVQQTPLNSFDIDQRLSSLNVVEGEDTQQLLAQFMSDMNHSRPEGWERLMKEPSTSGNGDIQVIRPAELGTVMDAWGLDGDMHASAYENINILMRVAVQEGRYSAQGFSLNGENCADVPRPVCLSTLIVTVQVQYVINAEVWRAEIGHVYLRSAAESIQQTTPYECCHRCWFHSCCHTCQASRELSLEEILAIKEVMLIQQYEWARENVSVIQGQIFSTVVTQTTQVKSASAALPSFSLDKILRLFLDNTDENEDVFKKHDEEVLNALQNATRTQHQTIRKIEMSVRVRDVPDVLESLLADCFQRAGVKESVQDWWKRVHGDHRSDIISVECEFANQQKLTVDPPVDGCSASANITTTSSYFMLVLTPRGTLIDCLFLGNNLDVSFSECEPLADDPSEDCIGRRPTLTGDDSDESEGIMIRWAIAESDGSFHHVHYLAQWLLYPWHINKAILDYMRFLTVSAYLGVPIPRVVSWSVHQRPTCTSAGAPRIKVVDPSIMAIMESIKLFAQTWEAVAEAFGTSISEDIRVKVCLGFDSVKYTARSLVGLGISAKNFPRLIEETMGLAQLPERNDLKAIMMGIKYSTNITWVTESMTYSAPSGEHYFLFLAKYGNAKKKTADVAYTMLKSKFVLAPDMLIVHQKESYLGGIFNRERTLIEYIPHTLTLNDTLILQMFWEMISFHNLAIAAGVPPQPYPDLSGLCDRTTG
ncbi:hypothetical protein BG011_000118 [Mortierella polycephala]|uniref:Uncharacterized protein n=1 Tax=Mortierella polycephala TaxID=41804 RepID=A0A9P6U6Y0_9FUNG|nr:hypothetical protein BG011_000118 [Mortierella polycephala]